MKGGTTMEIKKIHQEFSCLFCCTVKNLLSNYLHCQDCNESFIVLGYWERLRQDLAFYAVLPQSQPVAQGFRTWPLH